MALARTFTRAEPLGAWPRFVGVVMVCLIPTPDGGRRPIGLLPSMLRLWVRARLDAVRAWQAARERAFFLPKKGALVASGKQAARAELASPSSHMEWARGLTIGLCAKLSYTTTCQLPAPPD